MTHKETTGRVTDNVTAGPQQACHVKVIVKMGHFVSKYVAVGSIRGHSKLTNLELSTSALTDLAGLLLIGKQTHSVN